VPDRWPLPDQSRIRIASRALADRRADGAGGAAGVPRTRSPRAVAPDDQAGGQACDCGEDEKEEDGHRDGFKTQTVEG
jgi:hypothetical protein